MVKMSIKAYFVNVTVNDKAYLFEQIRVFPCLFAIIEENYNLLL